MAPEGTARAAGGSLPATRVRRVGGEPDARLVGEGRHLECHRQALFRPGQQLHHRDPGERPQRAVEPARVDAGLQARAEQQGGRPVPLALVAADQVAGRVRADHHAGVAHPAADQRLRPRPLGGADELPGAARLHRERREDVEPCHHLGRIP